jgi:hypothetical protein
MANTVSTEKMVRQLWARQQIHDALMRYSRGCDRCDKDLIRSAYHPDGHDDHGMFKGSPADFADWADNFHQTICTGTAHCILNHLVEFDANDENIAYGECYVLGWLRTKETDILGMGRYLDRFECRDGDWRIAHRTTLLDWQRIDPISSIPTMTLDILAGQRSRSDPSYQILPSGRMASPVR